MAITSDICGLHAPCSDKMLIWKKSKSPSAEYQRELISHQERGKRRVWIEIRWEHLVHCNSYIAAHDQKMHKFIVVVVNKRSSVLGYPKHVTKNLSLTTEYICLCIFSIWVCHGQVARDGCKGQVLFYCTYSKWSTSWDIRFVETSNRNLSCTSSLGLKEFSTESVSAR